MALSNYTELQAAVADFLNRDDLTTVIPDFIKLAEARFNRTIRDYRMVTSASLTIDNQLEDAPADFLETRRLVIEDTVPYPATYLSPNMAAEIEFQRSNTAGKPGYYTMQGTQFEFIPAPDATYTGILTYYAKIPDLATNSTNWLLTNHPDVYLYTTLIQSAPYLKDDERLGTWASLATSAMEELRVSNERAQYNASPLAMRPRRAIG